MARNNPFKAIYFLNGKNQGVEKRNAKTAFKNNVSHAIERSTRADTEADVNDQPVKKCQQSNVCIQANSKLGRMSKNYNLQNSLIKRC